LIEMYLRGFGTAGREYHRGPVGHAGVAGGRAIRTQPRGRPAATHRWYCVVDQAISEHGTAEGPADNRCHHRLSRRQGPASPTKCAKKSGHRAVSASNASCAPVDKIVPTGDGCAGRRIKIGRSSRALRPGPDQHSGCTMAPSTGRLCGCESPAVHDDQKLDGLFAKRQYVGGSVR
jgi:hypothetical protein